MNNLSIFQQFKQLVDEGLSPFQVADELGLTEDELVDFETAYADEKRWESQYDGINDSDDEFPFDGEAG